MSWKAEIIADPNGEWTGNALRFAAEEEADAYALDLAWRWAAVRKSRVVECEQPITYAWDFAARRAVPLKPGDVA